MIAAPRVFAKTAGAGSLEDMAALSEADVRAILSEVLKSDEPATWKVDFNFRQSGAVDSLDQATVALLLFERHGVKVTDQQLPGLTSIAAVLKVAAGK
jgi:acyl carrier protein